jgi:protein nanos 1
LNTTNDNIKEATNLYKKMLNSNLNERNLLNNSLIKCNDSLENQFNSIQISNLNESKPRHQSLFTKNMLFQNFNTSPNLSNLQSLNEYNAKKRANSFGLTIPSISYQSGQTNRFTNTQKISNISNTQQLTSYANNNNNNFYNSLSQNNSSTSISSESVMQNYFSLQSEMSASNKPLRSERLPSQIIDDIVKQAKVRRRSGGKKEVCVFCRNNGEKEQFYTSHTLKDAANKVGCPILRLYQCPICHASGDNAHTIKYCPYAEKDTGSIKLYKDSRMNTAVLLMNANNSVSSLPLASKHQSPLASINLKSFSNNGTNPLSNTNVFNNMSYNTQNSNSSMF